MTESAKVLLGNNLGLLEKNLPLFASVKYQNQKDAKSF
jgi:hypothetical protein